MRKPPTSWQEIDHKVSKDWQPDARSLAILAAAKRAIDSVPYRTTLRWIFYRLWQAGEIPLTPYTGSKAKEPNPKARAYRSFTDVMARARHANLLERNAIADDRRGGTLCSAWRTADDWLEAVARVECRIDPWQDAPVRPVLVFEAEAMLAQFQYHAAPWRVDLWPFSGDPSIDLRYAMAERIDELWPDQAVRLLYFGDADPKGFEISENLGSVSAWCSNDNVQAFRVGLSFEQAAALGLEDNPEKPGTYQWEALSDKQAGKIIKDALRRFPVDLAKYAPEEERATAAMVKAIDQAREELEASDA